MEKLIIYGGKKLSGKLEIKSAKNAVLPIMAASILCKGKVILKNIPKLTDIYNMCKLLRHLGCTVKRKKDMLIIDSSTISKFELPCNLSNKLRASIFLLGPLLALFKNAKLSYPGGCNIGNRPIDIHLSNLEKLGVNVNEQHGFLSFDATNITSNELRLRFPSVGATENLMMASVFCKGKTIINNCAKEPEIIDLQNFLNAMGADIEGAGTCKIVIRGVENLNGITYTPIFDRIVAGTYMIATMICGGNVELSNVKSEYLSSLIDIFQSNDCQIECYDDKIIMQCKGRLNCVPYIETNPYPEFPTDLQAQLMALQTISKGTSVIVENLFETRFKHVPQLTRMGADITIKNNYAIVCGREELSGAEVFATDLRAGASLVLAGLKAKGYTTINDIYHIDRGYDHIEKDLQKLGADIKRVKK